jgi:L-asparaginase
MAPSKPDPQTTSTVLADVFRGIVIMGVGPGGLSNEATAAANDLFQKGVVTVASLRPFFGAVVPGPEVSNM